VKKMTTLAVSLMATTALLGGCKFGPLPPTTAPATTSPATTTSETTTPATTAPATTAPATSGTTAAETLGWGSPIAAWSDDFGTAGKPNNTKWSVYNGPGHAGNGRRTPENINIQNGFLRITGELDGDSGGMRSRYDFTHGRIEARVRSAGKELNPVLIIWPTSGKRVQDGEYDFLELGDPGQACAVAFIHYPGETPKKQEKATETNCGEPLSEWHNVAVEWTDEYVRGFIDGREWYNFSNEDIEDMPLGRLTMQLDNTGTPGDATFDIDWVNFYAP
jgi:hypothetical protein